MSPLGYLWGPSCLWSGHICCGGGRNVSVCLGPGVLPASSHLLLVAVQQSFSHLPGFTQREMVGQGRPQAPALRGVCFALVLSCGRMLRFLRVFMSLKLLHGDAS